MTQDVSLEEMAKLVGPSQSQFARSFKISTGMPPYKWSLDARIKRAQELLLLGKEPIAFIALQTGFADQSHAIGSHRRQQSRIRTPGFMILNFDLRAVQNWVCQLKRTSSLVCFHR